MAATTTSIPIPEGYRNVILVSLGLMPVLSFLHGAVVTQIRRAAGVPYPHSYATQQQCETNPLARKFNCAQRAHANYLENMPQTMVCALVAGLADPRKATVAALLWVLARAVFAHGYITSDKPAGLGRMRGAWFWFPQGYLWYLAVFGVGAAFTQWPL
ncbi:hypothetical protein KEM52_004346 [Ascosphaera acerosa]|nr:hypothetical protein KEM52_004346 [Ascosphaera acerosa]